MATVAGAECSNAAVGVEESSWLRLNSESATNHTSGIRTKKMSQMTIAAKKNDQQATV